MHSGERYLFKVDFDYPAADDNLNALVFCLQLHFNFVDLVLCINFVFSIWISFRFFPSLQNVASSDVVPMSKENFNGAFQ